MTLGLWWQTRFVMCEVSQETASFERSYMDVGTGGSSFHNAPIVIGSGPPVCVRCNRMAKRQGNSWGGVWFRIGPECSQSVFLGMR